MSANWHGTATTLITTASPGWEGIWALTYAAGFGALQLALSVPLGVGVSISYAAMDFRDAQDEIEWARPDARKGATPVRLGIATGIEPAEAKSILDRIAAAALERAAALAEVATDLSDQAALSRVMARLITGRAKVTGQWA